MQQQLQQQQVLFVPTTKQVGVAFSHSSYYKFTIYKESKSQAVL
jgi:hypothetical protein